MHPIRVGIQIQQQHATYPQIRRAWQAVEASGAGAVVLTPAHQSPTGALLAPERRQALVAWAAAHDRGIAAIEFRPGNRRVAHHARFYDNPRRTGRHRDQADPGPGEKIVVAPVDIGALRHERSVRRGHQNLGHLRTECYPMYRQCFYPQGRGGSGRS